MGDTPRALEEVVVTGIRSSLQRSMDVKRDSFGVVDAISAEDIGADPSCLGLSGSPTKVVKVFPPEARGGRAVLTGTLDEQLDQLVDKLIPYL